MLYVTTLKCCVLTTNLPPLDDDFSSVRREVAALLQECFREEDHRPSAGWCRAKLISMWGRWDRESPWADYESELQPPRRSPCVFDWGDNDRAAEFYRVSQLTTELLIDRYSTAPDNVKSYTEIVNFLDKLHEKKVYALQKGAERSEKNRQQKYQLGTTTATITEGSSFVNMGSHKGVTNFDPTESPDEQISSGFSEEQRQKHVRLLELQTGDEPSRNKLQQKYQYDTATTSNTNGSSPINMGSHKGFTNAVPNGFSTSDEQISSGFSEEQQHKHDVDISTTSTAITVTDVSQIPPHNGTSTSDHTDTLTSDDTSSFSYQRSHT